MKIKCTLLLLLGSALLTHIKAQSCSGGFIFQYTGSTNMVWFQDHSNSNQSWQRDYTNWDFSDGTQDTGKALVHTFPQPLIYNVKKETKFSEIGNPSNFCIVTDSMYIDASIPGSMICNPHYKLKLQWITGSTYGISSYYSGCGYTLKEIAVTGPIFSVPNGPMPSYYSTSQNFFTYNLPSIDSDYVFTQHVILPTINGNSGAIASGRILTHDSIKTTPQDCHASFFMLPADSSMNNWTIQNYSSSAGTLSYFWDFGDGATSTQISPSHTYSTVGTYTVCLTVNSGTCSDTYCSTAFTDSTQIGYGMKKLNVVHMNISNVSVGVSENSNNIGKISLFPNPASNELNIAYREKESCQVTVADLIGRQHIQIDTDKNADSVKLNIDQLPAGIYVIQLRSQGKAVYNGKFIKE
ncbi:MAG: repeat-containing protein [Bacteroidetes bacterium]|jgi:PKD repeat protein|nr:repeat-containing protein [Bacteroidota bacterium]